MAAEVIDLLLRARMEASGVEAGVGQIQKSLKGLTLPKGVTAELEKSFGKLTPLLKEYQKQLNKGFSNKKDLQNFNALKDKISETFGEIRSQVQSVNSQDVRLKVDTQEIDKLENKITAKTADLQKALDNVFTKSVNSSNITDQLNKVIGNTSKASTIKPMADMAKQLFNTQDYAAYNNKIDELRNKILSLKTTKIDLATALGVKDAEHNLDAVDKKVETFFNNLKVNEGKVQTIEHLKQELKDLGINLENVKLESLGRGAGELKDIDSLISQLSGSLRETGEAASEAGSGMVRMVDEVNQLKTSTQYFFSLRNMLNLFKRGVKEAYEAVKELDAAMTETAVVTDFNVGDMWEKLPEYTANANALGASVKDMYEATTLYYQQGLNTEQAMGIANETMKMARIGGLEAADATDKMTAALRGFNMEINETSAQRVNDVYSNLAAKTASNTEELGTAMQRTASIAASAGMSFEGTAAFLAQAIETTREPAENLGTAMKTIVARFTELKKNPLEITEVDGEEVDYNKVDTALKSIGVSLKDANGQFRNLDQVFLDISQRWDSLTQTQQRYVATQAAGSRQQSRFIAMMSNYDRTVQLMDYANNSAGASNEQFGKTMESLEAKLNKLHNAWQQFEMGIANNAIIKTFVDGLTGFLNITNKIIDKLSQGSGVVKSFLSLFTAFAGLKGFSRLANIGLGGLAGAIDPNSSMREGLKSGLSGFKGNSQARAITNPIVAAIHGLIPHIDKAAQGDIPYKYQASGNYKEARAQLTTSLAKNKNSYSVGGVLDIFDANKLNKQQQKDFFQSSPGLKHNITKSLSNLFTEVGMDPKVSKGLIQGFSAGDFALDEVLASKSLSPEQVAKIMAPSDPQQAAKYVEDQYAKIQTQVMHDVATMDLSPEEEASAIEGLTEQRWKAATEAIPVDKIKAFKQATQDLSPTEKFANTIGKVGAGLTSAGYSMQMFGAEISKVNPLLGETISNMGGLLTTAGSLANILPSILSNPLALAGVAIVGAIAFDKYQSEKIKQAAEEVVNTYKDTTKEITEKVESLKSAQSVFDELGRGVDRYGNNINLTAEDYSKYLETVDDVAEMAPELIRGYDAQGHAILATGSAIDELITKQEELKKSAVDTFIDDSSINSLVAGIQESDAFKKAANTKKGDNYGYLTKSTDKIYETLANAGVQNFDKISKQLFGKEINLLEPSNEDLRILSEHYNDIINLIESENQNLTDKQKETLETAFSDLGSGWKDMTAEIQPLSQAIGQYLSSEGLDTIGLNLGEEFTASFNQGLESLSMTAAIEGWDSSRIKEEASNYAQGFKDMTKEGSEYARIMEQVTAEQEKYNDSIGDPGAIEAYEGAVEDYASQLEELANKYDDGTTAGQLFANTLRETANSVRNYATESIVDLGHALNTMSDNFTSARGAEERFKKAIEGGDYYTAAEGYKSIIDTVLDEKNVAGNGSIAGWTGAEEILGSKFVDSHTWDEVVSRIQSIAPMFEDGIAGVQKFGDFLIEAAGESGKELQGLGEVLDDGLFHFDFDLEEGELEKFADRLGLSTDALSALIDKSRQFVAWNTADMPQVRKALEQSGQSMVGQNGRLYTSESSFRAEAKQQGIFGDDYTKTKKDLQKEQNVEFLTVKSLTTKDGDGFGLDKVLANIGLTGADKNLNNTVAALSKMGFELEDQKKILTSEGIKLADGAVSEDDIAQAYNEQAYALENPTVAGIANDTGVIASAASMMLAKMGILTEDAKQKIDQSTSQETIEGAKQTLNPQGGFKSSAEHQAARSKLEAQITDYDATINALKESGNESLTPYITQLTTARDELNNALIADQDAWEQKISQTQSLVDNLGANDQEQAFLNQSSFDIQKAINTGDADTLLQTLYQIQTEGNLASQTMVDLTKSLFDSGQIDSSAYIHLINEFQAQVDALRQDTSIPFRIQFENDEELRNYINQIQGISQAEKFIIFNTELNGEEKVRGLFEVIDNEFGGGNEIQKSILVQATAKMAGGDAEGAHDILQKQFGDQAQEIETKLGIICDGSVANPTEVKSAIESEIENLNVSADVKANVKADTSNIKLNQNAKVNYQKGTQAKATDANATVNYNTIGTQVNPKPKDADVSYKLKSQEDPKDKTAYVKYKEKDAKGRNNTLPAHQSLSFGSAAGGMNIPKAKKSSKRTITALVGEKGFEVGYIPSEQRSVIFGANGPEMTSFPNDTIIYPHSESQEILRRGKRGIPTFGSFEVGLSGGIGSSGGGGKKGKKKKKKSKKKKSKKSKQKDITPTINNWSIEEAVRYNIDQSLASITEEISLRTKDIEKNLEKIGTTYNDIVGTTQAQITALEQVKQKNQELLASNQRQLADYRARQQYVSWTDGNGESQRTLINIASYLNADGSVNTGAIAGLGNRALQEAVYKEISSAKGIVDGIRNAQKAIADADQQMADLGKKISEAFYQWENELTEVYSLTKRINNEVSFTNRFTSQVELELAKLGAGFTNTAKAIANTRNVLMRNNATIQAQIKNQQQMVAARQRELEAALSYEDEVSKLNRFQNQTGVDSATKQANIEWAQNLAEGAKLGSKYVANIFKDIDGSIQYQIDWEKFNADNEVDPYSKTTYEAIKKYLDDLDSAATEFNNSIKDQTDFIKQTYDALKEYQDYVADMEDTLIKGVEEQIEQAKDNAKQLSDSITSALKDLLDEVKRKLDERRKQEDNAKTERDISQKQQRLAMLRADTAGGHQVEIAQLEKEIADSQQSYQRTLEDQLLDRLQQQADEASQQRERQIELMQAGNQIDAATNKELVDMWLKDPEKYKEEIKAAWLEAQGYDEKGEAGQYVLESQFESDFAQLVTAVEESNFKDSFNALTADTNSLAALLNELTNGQLGRQDELAHDLNALTDVTDRNTTSILTEMQKQNSVAMLKAKGADVGTLKTLGYTAQQMLEGGYTPEELRQAGYTAKELAEGGINDVGTLKGAGYGAKDIKDANVGTASDFKEAGFTAEELKDLFSLDELVDALYDAKALKNAGYDANALKGAGFGIQQLKDAGFTLPQLKSAFSATEFGAGGISYDDAKAAGYGLNDLKPVLEYASQAQQEQAAIDAAAAAAAAAARVGNGNPYGAASQTSGKINKGDKGNQVRSIQWALKQMGYYHNTIDGDFGNNTKKAVKAFQKATGISQDGVVGNQTRKKFALYGYKTGGLANYTGPAWLDGTPSKPELVLNATDTKNFLALRDVLSSVMKSTGAVTNSYGGDIMYDINIHVDKIEKDYDVDRVVDKVKKEITKGAGYRNVTQVRNFK